MNRVNILEKCSIASRTVRYSSNLQQKISLIEDIVGRKILGAQKYAAAATLREEIGMLEMRLRIG